MNYKINDNKWEVLKAGGLLLAQRKRLRRSEVYSPIMNKDIFSFIKEHYSE
jgi:hypothetical protein